MTSGEEFGPGGLLRPLDWSRRIEEALERDLFVLHGQRIVDVISGETMRHELFLRMVDRRRLIPAGEFVMAAEEFGSIREIDRWVVARAIEVAEPGMPVDLNLSVRSTDDAMIELIRDRLEETGADPADLVLELSEAQMTEGLDEARRLRQRRRGHRLRDRPRRIRRGRARVLPPAASPGLLREARLAVHRRAG